MDPISRHSSMSARTAPLDQPELDRSNPSTSASQQAHPTLSVAGGPGNNPAAHRTLHEIDHVVTSFPLEPPAYSHNLHSSNPQAESSQQAALRAAEPASTDTHQADEAVADEVLEPLPQYTRRQDNVAPKYYPRAEIVPKPKTREWNLSKLSHPFSGKERAAHRLREAVSAGNPSWIKEELQHGEADLKSSEHGHNALHKAALSTNFPPETLQKATSKMLERLGPQRSYEAVNAPDTAGKSPIQLAQEMRNLQRQRQIETAGTLNSKHELTANNLDGAVNAMLQYTKERITPEQPINQEELPAYLLRAAVRRGDRRSVNQRLDSGVRSDIQSRFDRHNAFHTLVYARYTDSADVDAEIKGFIAEELTTRLTPQQHTAAVQAQDRNGMSPLQILDAQLERDRGRAERGSDTLATLARQRNLRLREILTPPADRPSTDLEDR